MIIGFIIGFLVACICHFIQWKRKWAGPRDAEDHLFWVVDEWIKANNRQPKRITVPAYMSDELFEIAKDKSHCFKTDSGYTQILKYRGAYLYKQDVNNEIIIS